ncbi:sensor histidine kinase [Maribacter sp. 2210JD10-5]|uniref:sensor histidine kinase n=1 Tax=Maribacter sp. 2210JD10-5 TaxID=3386272 RepID=UPI0039BC522A
MTSFIKSNRWNIAFWIVQLAGWGGLVYFSYLMTPGGEYKQSDFYKYALISGFFIGVLTTSSLRYYLKRYISLDNFDGRDVLKLGVSVCVTALLYGGLSFATGYLKGYLGADDLEIPELYKDFGIGLAILNSFFLIIGWTIFYMSVKIAAKLNANRLERAELNTTLKQAQLNTLKAQINPHFMFNSLNNIRGLMLEDVEKSRDMLTKLSEMLRYSLTKNNVNAIALEEELEMVENYIALSKIQLEERLQFTQEIDNETLNVQIPPMIIQLLVENAVKHGISNLKSGGTIKLITSKTDNGLSIEVSNTGKLAITHNSTQLGLKNIRQRLRLLYGEKAFFSLKEVNDSVIARINIPLA